MEKTLVENPNRTPFHTSGFFEKAGKTEQERHMFSGMRTFHVVYYSIQSCLTLKYDWKSR